MQDCDILPGKTNRVIARARRRRFWDGDPQCSSLLLENRLKSVEGGEIEHFYLHFSKPS